MSFYARVSPDGNAVEEYPLRSRQLNQTGRNYGRDPGDATLEGSPFVLVRLTPPPPTTFGQTVEQGPLTKQADGHWHQTWQVFDPAPDRADEIRAELLALAEHVAAEKRSELTTAHVVTFIELARADSDNNPTAAEYPLINAIAVGRTNGGAPMTFAQALAAARDFRTNWVARAVAVEAKYREVIVRINNATTLAEAKAIFDELNAI